MRKVSFTIVLVPLPVRVMWHFVCVIDYKTRVHLIQLNGLSIVGFLPNSDRVNLSVFPEGALFSSL